MPKQMKDISVNMKAPIVINASTRKAVQIIVDGDEYKVKTPIYETLQMKKAEGKVDAQGGV